MQYRVRLIGSLFILFFALLPVFPADAIKAPAVHNFHQVEPHLYRGAQPTPAGIKDLAKLGVKTVVDLREGSEHSRFEKNVVNAAGMRYVSVPLKGFGAPSDEAVATILHLLDDSSAWPVFIHCKRGADRTGTLIACYRIVHDHWDNEKALKEAKLYGMSRLERAMEQYILEFKPPAGQESTPPAANSIAAR